MSFPETVDEILDVSEDEGEGLELGRTPRGLLAEPAPLPAAPGTGTGVGGAAPGLTGVSQRGGGEPTSLQEWLPLAQVLPCAVRGGDTWTSLWPHTPRKVCREPSGTWGTPPCSLGQYQLPARLQLVCSCPLPLRPHFCLFLLCRHCSCHSNGYATRLLPPAQWPISPHGH